MRCCLDTPTERWGFIIHPRWVTFVSMSALMWGLVLPRELWLDRVGARGCMICANLQLTLWPLCRLPLYGWCFFIFYQSQESSLLLYIYIYMHVLMVGAISEMISNDAYMVFWLRSIRFIWWCFNGSYYMFYKEMEKMHALVLLAWCIVYNFDLSTVCQIFSIYIYIYILLFLMLCNIMFSSWFSDARLRRLWNGFNYWVL